MEADWAAEIGPRLDRIDSGWQGFIDLRADPQAIREISEAAPGSALESALATLNGPSSAVFTCKCDRWPVLPEDLDPYEMETSREHARTGVASWIDVVARNAELFASFAGHEAWARQTVLRLRAMPLANGRVDLVIRAAMSRESSGFGITLYATGCGPDAGAAEAAWEAILRAGVNVTMGEAQSLAAAANAPASSDTSAAV
ncbi:MAG TPA: hypothetical protein VIY53_11920 [Acidobacteriaceae bacterium]